MDEMAKDGFDITHSLYLSTVKERFVLLRREKGTLPISAASRSENFVEKLGDRSIVY